MRRLSIAIVMVLAASQGAPAASAGGLDDPFTASLIRTFGHVPATSTVNGVPVPTQVAAELLAGPVAAGGAAGSVPDAGQGFRDGSGCATAVYIEATRISTGASAAEALEGEVIVGAPGGVYCSIPFVRGSATASVAAGASVFACVRTNAPVGGRWATGATSCGHANDFSVGTVSGNVAKISVLTSGGWPVTHHHVERIVAGVPGGLPGSVADAGAISVA